MKVNYCPQCGHQLNSSTTSISRSHTCSRCGASFVLSEVREDLNKESLILPQRVIRNKVITPQVIMTLGGVLLALIIVFSVWFIQDQKAREDVIATTMVQVDAIADDLSEDLKAYRLKVTDTAQTLKTYNSEEPADLEKITQLMQSIQSGDENITYAYTGFETKQMVLYPPETLPEDYDPTSRPWYMDAISSKATNWTPPYPDAKEGHMIVSLGQAFSSSTGQAGSSGVISLDIDLTKALEELFEIVINEKDYLIVVDSMGTTLTHPNEDLIGRPVPVQEVYDACLSGTEGVLKYEWQGADKTIIISKVEETGWFLLCSILN